MTSLVLNTGPASSEITRSREYFGEDYWGAPKLSRFLQYFDRSHPVLDFGCGEGVFLNILRENGFTGRGVDFDSEVVRRGREFGFDIENVDLFEFASDPAQHESYSGIMMAEFVEHFDPYVMQKLLRQTVDLLIPGGTMVLTTPNSKCLSMIMGGFHECTIEHHNLYSVSGLTKFLDGIGMKTLAAGVHPDSKLPMWSGSMSGTVRNLLKSALGRILVGRECNYESSYVVARKDSEAAEAARDRYAT